MPLYLFKCETCERKLEKLMPFGVPRRYARTVIAATNFSLKGSGWAKDNYGLKET